MSYWQLFYHIVWATKDREPIISLDKEPSVYEFIIQKATLLNGKVFAIGGVEDHVHLVVSIPPSIAVADFIGQVKGTSSALVNRAEIFPFRFRWQQKYGVFSFDRKRLPYIMAYVEEQKQHHHMNELIPVLEREDAPQEESFSAQEQQSVYLANLDNWKREMATI